MVKSKLPPRSGSSLEAVEPHSLKGAINLVFFVVHFSGFENEKSVYDHMRDNKSINKYFLQFSNFKFLKSVCLPVIPRLQISC